MRIVYFSAVLIGLMILTAVSVHGAERNLMISFLAVTAGLSISALVGLVIELLRPPAVIQQPGDCVFGTYVPFEDKLNPEACRPYHNKLLTWEAVWRIDKGEHAGDWAMAPKGSDHSTWVPLSELVIQERRRDFFQGRRRPK